MEAAQHFVFDDASLDAPELVDAILTEAHLWMMPGAKVLRALPQQGHPPEPLP